MYEFIRAHQLNIMLLICGACGILTFLLVNTRFLSKSRKYILILMEIFAFFLLWFDRLAYIYAGDPSNKGYIMVRISNFMVFFLTSGIVFGFDLYLMDWMTHEGNMSSPPRRLKAVQAVSAFGMFLAVIAAFTNLYYYFDETNRYHRGPGFLIAYIIPVLCPIVQYTVIRQYRKVFSKLIYTSLILYIFVPIACGIIQIFAYGISIVNMAMTAVSISLYISTYLDINDTVEHAHKAEIQSMQGEQKRMRRLFDQTAVAFVSAVEKKDDYTTGNAVRIAEYARKVARLSGKNEEECEKVYYAALLHDVGLIGLSDSVIKNDEDPGRWDQAAMHRKPVIGEEILSSITEYPYLAKGARYSHERYNGTGYPDGLSGEDIPEIARMIAVADAYVTMTTKKRYRDARPVFMAREAFVKGAGEAFYPDFARIMVQIIDSESNSPNQNTVEEAAREIESEIVCGEYRDKISTGISVDNAFKKITFDCESFIDPGREFSAPSVVLFDSYDGRAHNDQKTIEGYHYLEYGEIWFDQNSITTAARKIEERITDGNASAGKADVAGRYEITAGRYEDHIKLIMKAGTFVKEVIVALPNGSNAAYIGLTGENCRLGNISIEPTGETADPDTIPRIAKPISYIDHMESDIKNIQIDMPCSASTEGIEIKDKLKLVFHTMSLPGASLVWHCPYIVLFSSADGRVGGTDYHEYALIKLNGEDNGSCEYAQNRFTMKRTDDFSGWDDWKEMNRKGLECEVYLERKGNRITLRTDNLGISIENTTVLTEEPSAVYVALTGDQVALTDIRVM